MSSIAWYLGYAALASGLWAASAFLFRLRHGGRLLMSVAGPALFACLDAWTDLADPQLGWAPAWAPVLFAYGLFAAGLAAIVALPIWFLFEERLGWRAR